MILAHSCYIISKQNGKVSEMGPSFCFLLYSSFNPIQVPKALKSLNAPPHGYSYQLILVCPEQV